MIIKQSQASERELKPGITQTPYWDKATGSGSVSMGTVTLAPGCALPPHRHKVEDAMIVIAGKGVFVVDGQELAAEAGDALLAPAGSVHYIRNDGTVPFTVVYTWPSVEVERIGV